MNLIEGGVYIIDGKECILIEKYFNELYNSGGFGDWHYVFIPEYLAKDNKEFIFTRQDKIRRVNLEDVPFTGRKYNINIEKIYRCKLNY